MVALDIYFNYKGDESKRATVLARLSKARECAIDFFARHGLTLEPVFQVDSGLPDRMNSGSTVNLWDKFERSYSSNWGMLENQGRSKSEASICGLVVHELSHHLGLPDTYPDPDCPDQGPIGPLDDVMRKGGAYDASELRFYPWEIKEILKPLCGA